MARFLLIEPHDDIRRLYEAVVRGLGHELIRLDSDTAETPDVILVDPSDPVSLQTTTRLRQDYPDVAIVCASIYETTREDAEQLKAVAYLLKPFSLVELTSALEAAVAHRSNRPTS
ncbi:MAG: two-component system, cell cycle response regulator CpdR [Gaiellaceae bacterium]|jgi:CheY-like chemotaxis protein|nr:two-component system, cell cycle response regulator CpdR [Gaiellaceae bacterium]